MKRGCITVPARERIDKLRRKEIGENFANTKQGCYLHRPTLLRLKTTTFTKGSSGCDKFQLSVSG